MWLGNALEYLDVYLACAKAGLVVVPINLPFTPAAGVRDLADLVAGGSPAALPDQDPDELLIIGYTSGTTGIPKGAELTHGSVERLALTMHCPAGTAWAACTCSR